MKLTEWMGRLVGRRGSLENPQTPLSEAQDWMLETFGGRESKAGIRVTPENAMKTGAVYACVRVIAETIAALPLGVYRKDGASREPVPDHPLHDLLHFAPNDEMSSYAFRESQLAWQVLWGNAYAEISRDRAGRVASIYPIGADRVQPKRETDGRKRLYYDVETVKGKKPKRFAAADILHVPALGWNGIVGLSPIRLAAREAIGLSRAAEEFGAQFFGNGSNPSGILTHPESLSQPAARRLKKDWEEAHGGRNNAHSVAVLEEDIKWTSITIPPEEAQFLETRKFQRSDIAGIFKVPPHMIGDLERATFSNIEHQAIDFVVHTITPYVVRWEQELARKLLTRKERADGLFLKFTLDGLLRGDIKSRYEAYAVGRQNGWLSANDIRSLEDMNPVDGGEIYLVPLNMVPADQAGQLPEPSDTEDDDPVRQLIQALMMSRERGEGTNVLPTVEEIEVDEHVEVRLIEHRRTRSIQNRQRIRATYRGLLLDVAKRTVNREVNAAKRATAKLESFLEDFYDGHRSFIIEVFGPLLRAFMEAIQREAAAEMDGEIGVSAELQEFVDRYVEVFATRYIESSRGQLRKLNEEAVDAESAGIAIAERLEQWRDRRPDKIADHESVRAAGAFVKTAYAGLAVTLLRWVTVGETCPFCRRLDGRVVGIEERFVAKGESIDNDDGEPLTTYRDISHPPLHEGCDCVIVSGD